MFDLKNGAGGYPGPPERGTGESLSKLYWNITGDKTKKLKLSYFSHILRRQGSLGKAIMLGKTEVSRKRGKPNLRCIDSIKEDMGWVYRSWAVMLRTGQCWHHSSVSHQESELTQWHVPHTKSSHKDTKIKNWLLNHLESVAACTSSWNVVNPGKPWEAQKLAHNTNVWQCNLWDSLPYNRVAQTWLGSPGQMPRINTGVR